MCYINRSCLWPFLQWALPRTCLNRVVLGSTTRMRLRKWNHLSAMIRKFCRSIPSIQSPCFSSWVAWSTPCKHHPFGDDFPRPIGLASLLLHEIANLERYHSHHLAFKYPINHPPSCPYFLCSSWDFSMFNFNRMFSQYDLYDHRWYKPIPKR